MISFTQIISAVNITHKVNFVIIEVIGFLKNSSSEKELNNFS